MAAMRMHPPRLLVASIAAACLAILTLLGGAGIVLAAPGDCVLRVAVGQEPSGEGATSLTIEPDVEIILWGSFVPDAQIDLTFTWNGAPYGDYTPGIADGEGDFMFVHSFPASQLGSWTVTAGVERTECAGTVAIEVVAAGSASPAPTASAVPNTATAAPASPWGAATPAALTLLTAVALLIFAVRVVRRIGSD